MNSKQITAEVVVASVVYRKGFFIGDKFLDNQKEIQAKYPASELVLATNEADFVPDLEQSLKKLELRGRVLHYTTIAPEYARTYVWNIACGREVIRQYVASRTQAAYLLWVDSDMTYDAALISVLKEKIRGYGVAYSGYAARGHGLLALSGGGCCLMNRAVAERIRFNCYEYKSGFGITEDMVLELDLITSHVRMRKGFFMKIDHYDSDGRAWSVVPRKMGFYRITQSVWIRYLVLKSERVTHWAIGTRLRMNVHKALSALKLSEKRT
jgi:hypothetical protein